MPKFLNTALAYGEMQQIVTNAEKELVLISPYIQIPSDFLQRLKQKRNLKITVVCREGKLKSEEINDLRSLQNLELHFVKHLHAKCFYNEDSMVIGSLNLYDHSVQNNHEMGILLTINDDAKVFSQARNEAEHIVNLAQEDCSKRTRPNYQIFEPKASYQSIGSEKKAQLGGGSLLLKDIGNFIDKTFSRDGYCIRCGDSIPSDLDKPYCRACYDSWAEWKNPDYEEKFCHNCGKKTSTSMNKPQCRSCYKKS